MQGQLTEQISTVPPTNAYIKLNLNLPDLCYHTEL